MFYFLDSIPINELRLTIQIEVPSLSESKIPLERDLLYGFLFAIFGFDILYSKSIRRLVVEHSSEEKLDVLRTRLLIPRERKRYDLGQDVADISWRYNASIVELFRGLYDIDEEFLPAKPKQAFGSKLVTPLRQHPPLFDYQIEVKDKILENLKAEDSKRLLVQLPTGSGKTRTMMATLLDFLNSEHVEKRRCTILWVAHTQELCIQAYEAFERLWSMAGTRSLRLTKGWGGAKLQLKDVMNSFVITSYQKLNSIAKAGDGIWGYLSSELDVFVIDEAHKALAPTMSSIINTIMAEGNHIVKLVGLTATPGRASEAPLQNMQLASLFGDCRISATSLGTKPIEMLQNRGILSRISISAKEVSNKVALSDSEQRNLEFASDLPSSLLKRLAQNNERNELILKIIKERVEAGCSVLVFACSVDHAKQLAVESTTFGARSAAIDYSMRESLREKVLSSFREGKTNVIFNFGVLSTGFDAPNIDVVIIARPTTSIVLYSQMIGRGLRGAAVGGTESCELIDIRDNFDAFGDLDEVYAHFEEYWKK